MLQLCEGFDWIDDAITSSQLTTLAGRKWSDFDLTNGTDAITEPGIGDNGRALALREVAQYVRFELKTTPGGSDEVGVACWVNLRSTQALTGNQDFIALVDTNGSTYHMNLRVNSNNQLALYRGSDEIEVLDFIIPNNEWHHYALKQIVGNTTGSYTVEVDGIELATGSSVDTSDGGNEIIGYVRINGVHNYVNTSNPSRTVFDNIVAWDNNGGNVTDFPGLTLVRSIFPDGDGDDEDWSLSSGTDSFSLVNETAPRDDDSDYIEDSTTSNRTLFTYDDVDSHDSFLGIQLNSVIRETDASDFTLVNTLKSGGTLYPQTGQAVAGQTYENLCEVLDEDPDTSSAWTESGLNALQAGVEVG